MERRRDHPGVRPGAASLPPRPGHHDAARPAPNAPRPPPTTAPAPRRGGNQLRPPQDALWSDERFHGGTTAGQPSVPRPVPASPNTLLLPPAHGAALSKPGFPTPVVSSERCTEPDGSSVQHHRTTRHAAPVPPCVPARMGKERVECPVQKAWQPMSMSQRIRHSAPLSPFVSRHTARRHPFLLI